MDAMDDISGSSWDLMQNGKYEGDDVKVSRTSLVFLEKYPFVYRNW